MRRYRATLQEAGGAKYLHRKSGQVIALYMSTVESNGQLTISTSTMQATAFDGNDPQIAEYSDPAVAQVIRVLQGQLFVKIDGMEAMMSTDDTAVVPVGSKF